MVGQSVSAIPNCMRNLLRLTTPLFHLFTYIFRQLKAKVVKAILEELLYEQKTLGARNNEIYNLWQNDTIQNDIESKSSSNRCFRVHNINGFCTVLAVSLFFFLAEQVFFYFFLKLKEDNLYTKIMQ